MQSVVKKSLFWHFTLRDILGLVCAAAVPIALAVYTAVSTKQEQQQAARLREFDLQQAIELRQQTPYDKFLSNVYSLNQDGHLNDSEDPWAFANAYYRAAHRHWDPLRKGDVLQFLKEKRPVGRNNYTTKCQPKKTNDIIRLDQLSFIKVYLASQTGTLNRLNLECVQLDRVSLTNAMFSFVNLDGASFDGAQLNNVNFDRASLVGASFNGTDLRGVDFGDSDLQDAQYSNVDLSTAKLTDKQKKQASFFNTTMPDGSVSQTTNRTVVSSTTAKIAAATNVGKVSTIFDCFSRDSLFHLGWV